MEQLLSIKHVPIKIEVNVTRAQLKRIEGNEQSPSVKVSKSSGGDVKLAAQPYKIDISAPAQRFDSYTQSPVAESGLKLTYDAVARMVGAESGAVAQGGDTQLTARNASRSIEAILSKLPKTKNSSISYNDGTLSINYAVENSGGADNSEPFDLSSGFEFVPGNIEFIVSQMPDLEIEYLGEPIYFPRSADPNYEGAVDVMA